MKKIIAQSGFLLFALAVATPWQSCKKKDSNSNSNGNSSLAIALAIPTGPHTTAPDKKITYEAIFIDKDGNTIAPASVTWTVGAIGGSNTIVGNISGSGASAVFTPSGIGCGVVTASAVVNGKTLSAQVPVGVQTPPAYTVIPSAVVRSVNDAKIKFNTVYLGTDNLSLIYESSDNTVADVDIYGTMSIHKAGACVIKVSSAFDPSQLAVSVPVLANPSPTAALPVSRVEITVPGMGLFNDRTDILAAVVYDASNAATNMPVTWASQNPDVVTVEQLVNNPSTRIHPIKYGKAVITATAKGMTGYSEINVLPDTVIISYPNWIAIPRGGSAYTFAGMYTVDHATRALTLTPGVFSSAITTSVADYGIGIPNIASINPSGMVTISASATVGQSAIITSASQSPTVAPGITVVRVSDCDCGPGTSGVAGVVLSGGLLSFVSLGSTINLNVHAYDVNNNIVAGAVLGYCVDNSSICTVDNTGNVTAVGYGTATVTVCNGNVQRSVNIVVN